jgi:CheY-like chemotaxis protein
MAAADGTIGRLTTGSGGQPRVVLVGGTPTGSMVAAVLVEQFGCMPVTTPTGESVLALLRRNEQVDLVIIDLSVPDMDGIVAVQLIRALGTRGTLPVVALTDDRADVAAPRARAAGFASTVLKPYSPRELYGAMHAALTRAGRATIAG